MWAVEFPGLRLLTSAFAMEDSMRAKRIITRAILATAAAGSIATGVVVPLMTAAAPASGTVVTVAGSNYIGYNG